MKTSKILFAVVSCVSVIAASSPSNAGAQPGPGVVSYSQDQRIASAIKALALAETELADALARQKVLWTVPIPSGGPALDAYLQPRAELAALINRLLKEIAGLQSTLEQLGVDKRVYENQVAMAKLETARETQASLAARQAAVQEQAEQQRPDAGVPLSVATSPPSPTVSPSGRLDTFLKSANEYALNETYASEAYKEASEDAKTAFKKLVAAGVLTELVNGKFRAIYNLIDAGTTAYDLIANRNNVLAELKTIVTDLVGAGTSSISLPGELEGLMLAGNFITQYEKHFAVYVGSYWHQQLTSDSESR